MPLSVIFVSTLEERETRRPTKVSYIFRSFFFQVLLSWKLETFKVRLAIVPAVEGDRCLRLSRLFLSTLNLWWFLADFIDFKLWVTKMPGFVSCGPNEVLVISGWFVGLAFLRSKLVSIFFSRHQGCCHSKPYLMPGGRVFVWPWFQMLQK